jgi:hypothetical protein
MTKKEMEAKQRLLRKEKRLEDMSMYCGREDVEDCRDSSLNCYQVNDPDKKTCQKCLCGTCNRAHSVCHPFLGTNR